MKQSCYLLVAVVFWILGVTVILDSGLAHEVQHFCVESLNTLVTKVIKMILEVKYPSRCVR